MSKKKDLNYVAKLERAISKEYGKEAIINPKDGWTDVQEEEYLKQSKTLSARYKKACVEKTNLDGVLVTKRLFTPEKDARTCPVCSTYSFSSQDDVYMKKFKCCFECYIQHIEDREERWESGWRPALQEE